MSEKTRITPKVISGIVVNVNMEKSAKLRIDYTEKHPLYKKYVRRSKTLIFHDEKNECKVGDRVSVMETRALSKVKRHRLIQIMSNEA